MFVYLIVYGMSIQISENQIYLLTPDTTNIGNQTVSCILLSAEECEFCYSTGDSCQNLTCISATETPILLPSLTELTNCYHATASVSGNPVAVIQDTFNTGMHLLVMNGYTCASYSHFFIVTCLQLVPQLH